MKQKFAKPTSKSKPFIIVTNFSCNDHVLFSNQVLIVMFVEM